MGFITSILNQINKDAVIEAMKANNNKIANDNSQANQVDVDDLRRRFEAARSKSLEKQPQAPTYSYLVWTGTDGKDKKLIFHVAKDLQHTYTSKITQYPVEMQSDITDHVVINNPTFSASVIFSNATELLLGKVPDVTIDQDECYNTILDLIANRTTVAMNTPLGLFVNLIITSVSAPKNIEVGRSIQVDLDLEGFRTVELATLKIAQRAKGTAVDKACAAKVDEGNKVYEAWVAAKNKSLADTEAIWRSKNYPGAIPPQTGGGF